MIYKPEYYIKNMEKIKCDLEIIRKSIECENIHSNLVSLVTLSIDKQLAFSELLLSIFESLKTDIPLEEYYQIMDALSKLINRFENEN